MSATHTIQHRRREEGSPWQIVAAGSLDFCRGYLQALYDYRGAKDEDEFRMEAIRPFRYGELHACWSDWDNPCQVPACAGFGRVNITLCPVLSAENDPRCWEIIEEPSAEEKRQQDYQYRMLSAMRSGDWALGNDLILRGPQKEEPLG